MTIKHLVLSGGGHTGLQELGILQRLEQQNIWRLSDIKSIYATSAGSIITLMIALGFEWQTILDYILIRPWHEAYPIQPLQFFNVFTKKGWFDISTFEIFYEPFFKAKDIPLTITMKEFFELTNIDCHFFSTEINSFQNTDLSYTTYPDLPIIHAVYMSSSIPFLFVPLCIENQCFLDGGIFCNYPLQHCFQRVENKEEILGIKKIQEMNYNSIINDESSILDFTGCFVHNITANIIKPYETTGIIIPNEIKFQGVSISFQILKDLLYLSESRKEWIDSGYKIADTWLQERERETET
jgi:predicted acylesterase/phospholipase RssA